MLHVWVEAYLNQSLPVDWIGTGDNASAERERLEFEQQVVVPSLRKLGYSTEQITKILSSRELP